MIKKFKLRALTYLRNIYARIICPQVCFFCGEETGTGIPLCSKCLQKEIVELARYDFKSFVKRIEADQFLIILVSRALDAEVRIDEQQRFNRQVLELQIPC